MIHTFHDLVQGTPDWFAVRAGIPTASEFDAVIAKGAKGGESKTRRTYFMKKVGERLTGQPAESYSNAHMERGRVMESEALAAYALVQDVDPVKVGFVLDDALRAGCSPDAFVGDEGVVEIKTKLPHLQLEVLLAGELPDEHRAQVQGALAITGRQWCDFVSYWPGLPLFVKRVHRDEEYIAMLRSEIHFFNDQVDDLVRQFQGATVNG